VIEQEISVYRTIRDRICRSPFPPPDDLLALLRDVHSEASPELMRKVLHDVARDLEDELAHSIERDRHVGPSLKMDDRELAAEQRIIAVVQAAAARIRATRQS
jgi:hypothetical protein